MAKVWLKRVGLALALVFLVLTFLNASWLTPAPGGYLKLIAHRGAYQLFSHKDLGRDTCTATRIEQPYHRYLENTLEGMLAASGNGAQMIELDIAPTKDGRLVVFHDWTLECRTNGTGNVRDHTLDELKALDIGHGYSADGGKTFPFRGKGIGLMPTIEEVLATFPTKPLLFNFKGKDAAEADLLAAAIKAAGRDSVKIGDGFYGGEEAGPVARVRQLLPGAWAFSKESITACTKAYAWQGWLTLTPAACENGTIAIPLNRQWLFAGWPNRLSARMAEAGARVILMGPTGSDDAPMGLDLPEQIGEVPRGFVGYLWVDDIQAIGPALHPKYNRRNPVEDAKFHAAFDRRRAARE